MPTRATPVYTTLIAPQSRSSAPLAEHTLRRANHRLAHTRIVIAPPGTRATASGWAASRPCPTQQGWRKAEFLSKYTSQLNPGGTGSPVL